MNGDAMKEESVEIVESDGTVRTEKIRVTPAEILRKILDDPLYDPVRAILAESNEGILQNYTTAFEASSSSTKSKINTTDSSSGDTGEAAAAGGVVTQDGD